MILRHIVMPFAGRQVSHRVAVMFLGEIVEIGPRAAIFANPQHPYTRRLLAAVPIPDPERRGSKRRLPELEIRSPLRPPGHIPPPRSYRECAPGHLVMEPGEDRALPGAA